MTTVFVIFKDTEHFDYKRTETVLVTTDEVLARRMVEELADHIDWETAERLEQTIYYSCEEVSLVNSKEVWKKVRGEYYECE